MFKNVGEVMESPVKIKVGSGLHIQCTPFLFFLNSEFSIWYSAYSNFMLFLSLQGAVKRQALYACSTCTPRGEEPAGICLACSYECHGTHKLFELYTKR